MVFRHDISTLEGSGYHRHIWSATNLTLRTTRFCNRDCAEEGGTIYETTPLPLKQDWENRP